MPQDKSKKKEGKSPHRQWVGTVPSQTRQRIARSLDSNVSGLEEVSHIAKTLLGELLKGNLPPEISKEARSWTELLFTVEATKHSTKGTPEAAFDDVITALVQVRREAPRLEPAYSGSVIEIESKIASDG